MTVLRNFSYCLLFLGLGASLGLALPAGACESDFRTEDLAYRNGDIGLAGTIYFPAGAGPFPGVVVVQGSGNSGRANVWSQTAAKLLAGNGVAALLTDKRGVGVSGGDWRTSGFEDLADDALAGVAALRAHPELMADKVGLIGLSQGGRVVALAASRGQVEFVINFSGSAVPAKTGLYHELEQSYRQHGLADDDIAFLQEMTRLSFVFIESGEGFEEYLARRKEIRERFGEIAVETWPETRDHWYWTFWRLNHDFDPVPHWKTVVEGKKIPVFIAYGEDDEKDNVPVAASVRRLNQQLDSNLLSMHVYPGVGHGLWVHRGHRMVFTRPLREDLETWLDVHVLGSATGSG